MLQEYLSAIKEGQTKVRKLENAKRNEAMLQKKQHVKLHGNTECIMHNA